MATQAKPGVIAAHFPAGGIDLSQAFARQPAREVLEGIHARTTPSAVNVLGYETLGDRLRGGSRPGLSRLGPRPIFYLIQELNQIITDNDMQSSISGRAVYRIAIAQGNLYWILPGGTAWTIATDNASATPPLNETGIMQSASNIQRLYFADGVNWTYWDPDTNAMEDWEAQDGTLPIDSENNKPRLICTWRGRTVLSGILLDGQSLFASAIGDPHDFDYGRVPFGADMAWSFSPSSAQGTVGDKVTGLLPFSDDVLILGGEHSIQQLTGDVTHGGRLQFITDSIGMAWGKAWCRDPAGNIFFVSNKLGIYVMRPNTMPERISQPVEQLLQDIDTGDMNIVCGYDSRTQAIHFFISPLAEPGPARHLTLELRTKAWSELVFANSNHDPLCCAIFEGNEPGDRGLHFGSWIGGVHKFDHEAEDDDGTEIDSEVVIGPFLTPTIDEVFVAELQGVLAETSGDVDFDVLVGRTAEAALDSTPVYSGTFGSGRGFTNPVRRAAHAIYVKLRSTNKWAMEQIRLAIETRGLLRQRAHR